MVLWVNGKAGPEAGAFYQPDASDTQTQNGRDINQGTMSGANEKKAHQGRNVKRFREMLGLKQEGLAMELGEGWTQRRVSLLEGKEELEPELLEQVARVLKVPAEAIRHLDEEGAVNIIATTFAGPERAAAPPSSFAVNPVEKWIVALEENKKLYERLLQAEREKVALLEKVLAERQWSCMHRFEEEQPTYTIHIFPRSQPGFAPAMGQ